MKKSMYMILCRMATATVAGLLITTAFAPGQSLSGTCNAMTPDELAGSHILCAPYRDLNPFSSLPGEVNQWGLGTVYLNTGDSVTGRFLVYNALGSNLLSVKYGTETIFQVDKSTVKGFAFRSEKNRNEVLTYAFFPLGQWYYSDGEGAFMEVLVNDNVSLYHLVTIEKFPMSDNLKGHPYYFLQQRDSDLTRIRPNRKSLCRILECPDEFRKQLRSQHLRAGKRDRMIDSVREYNRYIKGH